MNTIQQINVLTESTQNVIQIIPRVKQENMDNARLVEHLGSSRENSYSIAYGTSPCTTTVKNRKVFNKPTVVPVSAVSNQSSATHSAQSTVLKSKRTLVDDEQEEEVMYTFKKQRTRCLEMFKKGRWLFLSLDACSKY